ncbi:MAG: type II secretion system F family protein [Actinomycetia bacterium]|nr:type II secretion system F family protein [Actinomycetes bacterium]MCP4223166.1 type II secretion system F family protein [Actinomycetes bacterium]MCP5032830.1 type II secretion system F family protein [Actinomycetes bacterium]
MFDFLPSIPLEGLVGLAGFGVALLMFFVMSQLEERTTARSTLRQLDDYEVENQREKELLAPVHERLLAPVVAIFTRLGGRLNPPEYVDRIRQRHIQAGITSTDRVERFLAIRILGFVFIPFWLMFSIVLNPLGLEGLFKWAFAILGVVIGAVGPSSRLNSAVAVRQKAIQRALPDVLDLLVISVEAGLGFEQAVDRVITNVPGELADEFARVLGETQAGSSRADALRNFQERVDTPEIRSFVLAMIQADTFGVSIGRVLRAQADEMRVKRRQMAQEKAQKAPVKMMIPMVLCIFPALFVVVLGPAMINISRNL